MFGRMMNETLGKIHFWGTIIPFNCIFIPLFVLGAAGEHRRIFDYPMFPELARPALAPPGSVRDRRRCSIMLSFQIVFFYNLITSLLRRPEGREESVEVEHARVDRRFAAAARQLAGAADACIAARTSTARRAATEDYWPQNAPKLSRRGPVDVR